jgi:peptidoglycan/LPS O-acetylase OafA/YrhL
MITRLKSLQGLRGIAALTVAVSHFLAAFYLTGNDTGYALEFLRPVSHLMGILAHKAVWIFFVLSGFVLTLQLNSSHYTYMRYLGSRLLRLYVPVWFAIIVNLAVIYAVSPNRQKGEFWIGVDPETLTFPTLVLEFLLISEGFFLGPLWSLKWEVVFSIFAFAAWKTSLFRQHPKTTIVSASALSMLGEFLSHEWTKYLPMFIVGVALYHLHRSKWAQISKTIAPTQEIAVLALAVFLPVSGYVLTSFQDSGLQAFRYVLDVPLSLLATSLLFYCLSRGRILNSVLNLRWLQFLGDISFSLYLLHAPIITLGLYLSDFDLLVGCLFLGLSIPLSHIAFAFVEKPSRRLSRKVRVNEADTLGQSDQSQGAPK